MKKKTRKKQTTIAIFFQLTPPLGEERVDVHEETEEFGGLVEAWLVVVEGDK